MTHPSARTVPAKYVNALLRSKAGARLVAARMFPNAKEITESYAARNALRFFVDDFPPDDPAVVLVSVGDGTTPRTAATFATTTRWQCHAIDPRLRASHRPLDRLTVHPCGIETVGFTSSKAVLVMVHAHVGANTALHSVSARDVLVIALPCCVAPGLAEEPAVRYRDADVGSPQNEVLVWRIQAPAPPVEKA
jgi:hypothetical protein